METKTYTLSLNRLSKIVERVATLRAEANQKVNELMTPTVVHPKDVDVVMAKLKENNLLLQENLSRTNSLINLQHYLRGVIMKENASSGVTDLLIQLEQVGQRSKFMDHLMASLKGGNVHLRNLGMSQKDTPRLDEAEPLLAEMKDTSEKVKAFLKEVINQPSDTRDLLANARNLVQNTTVQNLIISPLSRDEVKALEEESKDLRRKANALHDELSSLNAKRVNVDLPVDVAKDLGLPA